MPQTEIARTIRRKGGDYLLALKENWPATHAEVEKAFADPKTTLERSKTVDADHGRIEVRRPRSVTISASCTRIVAIQASSPCRTWP